MRLLQVLWDRGESTVEEVVSAHPRRERPNYKTTHTLLRIMEQKGYVSHEVKGRVFVFRAIVSRKTVDHDFVQALLAQNFGGSATELFVKLLESVPAKEIDELENYLREYRQKSQMSDPDQE